MTAYKWLTLVLLSAALSGAPMLLQEALGQKAAPQQPTLQPKAPDQRRVISIGEEVRHQLVTLSYYSVFDWLEANVAASGEVTLSGEVVRPSIKSDAETRVKALEGVTSVVNKIETLPLSPNDDQLRIALYRAIFNYNSPLFRYGTAAVPSIHIIVNGGRVSLKGIVASAEDGQLAYLAARQVPGTFDVQNELQVERNEDDK